MSQGLQNLISEVAEDFHAAQMAQERADLNAWLDDASDCEIVAVEDYCNWLIRERTFDDPLTETIGRLASLKLSELIDERAKNDSAA